MVVALIIIQSFVGHVRSVALVGWSRIIFFCGGLISWVMAIGRLPTIFVRWESGRPVSRSIPRYLDVLPVRSGSTVILSGLFFLILGMSGAMGLLLCDCYGYLRRIVAMVLMFRLIVVVVHKA
jgi:hypothetical protein